MLWKAIVARTLQAAAKLGVARVTRPLVVASRLGWWETLLTKLGMGQPAPTVNFAVLEQMLAASRDKFDEVFFEFGDPARLTLAVGSGHPLLWIALARTGDTTPEAFAREAAEPLPLIERSLSWNQMFPLAWR